jgi:glycosyltransferase involved in cell wall biosynthesis
MNDVIAVSVVVPCYRCAKTVRRAVASIAAQTKRPAEVILVDDGSHDDTRQVLNQIADEQTPGWIKLELLERNVGAASARNAGWSAADQPYIAFLDADDAWHPKKLELQYAYMESNPDVVLCGHGHRLLKEDVFPDWNVLAGSSEEVRKWPLLLSNQFVTPSVMVRRAERHRFVESQRYMEDHMLWLQILCHGGRVIKLKTELAAIYKESFGAKGLSAQIWSMERGELNNYQRLHRAGFLTVFEYLALCIFSLMKFLRRLVIYGGYLRWKR